MSLDVCRKLGNDNADGLAHSSSVAHTLHCLVAIIALVLVSVGRVRLLPKRRSDYVVLAFTGVLMFAINYALLFWGELYVSSGLAAILQASIPIFGMVFAHWLLPEEPL